jgi:hypothetical protein
MWGVTEVLLMKAWLETRWRLLAGFGYSIFFLAGNHRNPTVHGMVIGLGTLLTIAAMMLAGTGVKSQSPAGFPEGLAGSTQFTISLPVSRLRLLTVRSAVGLLESAALAVLLGCMTWSLFPAIRSAATLADFARLNLIALLFMTAPYCAVIFFTTFVDEPLSGVYAGWTVMLLLWGLHHIAPGVDVIRAWGQESPLITHRLPWPQMATSAGLALLFFWAAVRVVRTREY